MSENENKNTAGIVFTGLPDTLEDVYQPAAPKAEAPKADFQTETASQAPAEAAGYAPVETSGQAPAEATATAQAPAEGGQPSPAPRRRRRPSNRGQGQKAAAAEAAATTEASEPADRSLTAEGAPAPKSQERGSQNRSRDTGVSDQKTGRGSRSGGRGGRNDRPRQEKQVPATALVKSAGNSKDTIKVIPLGGLESIGMNITAFECQDSIIIVDCGLAFPTDDMLGIDLVIPDVTYLEQNLDKVKGFVITHGHEDHIGALAYILKKVNVPVYGTKLTIALIENKLKEHNLMKNTKRKVVKHGQSVNLGCFRVEFIKTNHSIADASALAIFSPAGTIVHTGDFKIDYTPVFGDSIDLQRFAELGKKGVMALLCDSTNAIRQGFTSSERTVGKTFDTIFADHQSKRIIVATFASNVDRVQQIINTAYKYGRKAVVEGRSMVNVIGTASELGYIKIPEGTLIDIEQLKNYPPEKTVLITTGSQGESMAALSRMAASIHRKVSITPNDVIILSSTPIPGNEKAVSEVINELERKGAEVINQDTHVSGHACAEEIKLIYSLVRPQYSVPVHGEFRHRKAQAAIAINMGIPKENTMMINSGDVLEMSKEKCEVTGHVQQGGILVDGLGVGDVGNIVLRDRQNLAQNGIIVVVLTLEKYSNQLLAGPDIVSRGFVYVRESEDLLEEAQNVVDHAVADCLEKHVSDWGKIKNIIKDSLSDFLWKRMKRSPVILPIIMEV